MKGEEASITPYLCHHDNCFMCQICNDKQVDTVLLPCQHTKMCTDCADNVIFYAGNCPYCRLRIIDTFKVYIF